MVAVQDQTTNPINTNLNNDPFLSKDKISRQPPPRLQHSPSLPNIRFPPHSDHQPPELSPTKTEEDDDGDRPTTPPPMGVSDSPLLPRKSLQHRETQSIDDVASYLRQKIPKKTHKRRATGKHDLGQALLTPPLTPSSSMKTSTSFDSADDGNDEPERDTSKSEATRFLHLSNISKTVSSDVIRSNIIETLLTGYAELSTVHALPYLDTALRMESFDERSVKGIFLRRHQLDGIVLLAFWDIRHAEIALRILSAPNRGPLSACIGHEDREGKISWIDCKFVTGEELAETAGSSAFLVSTSGGFRIEVEDTDEVPQQGDHDSRVVDDRSDGEELSGDILKLQLRDDDRTPTVGKDRLNPKLLLTLLNSFGDVKACTPSDQLEGPNGKTFAIEYFNIIDAINAYRTINGQELFGMRINVFDRDEEADDANLKACPWVPKGLTRPISPTDSSHSVADEKAHVSAPGHLSQMCYSFYGGPQVPLQPHAQDRHLVPYPTSSASPSPVVLYTANPPQTENPVPHLYLPAVQGIPAIQLHHPVEALPPHAHIHPHIIGGGSPPRAYGVQDRAYPAHVYHPGYYYPQAPPTPDSARLGYFPPPSPFPMSPDHASLAAMPAQYPTRSYGYYGGVSGPVTPTVGINSHPWPHPPVNAPHQINDQNWGFVEGVRNVEHENEPDSRSSPGPRRPDRSAVPRGSPTRLHGATPFTRRTPLHQSRSDPSQGPPERNQLNLARIEDGQDTRTTVMIKNIPNKMSDKDLVVYINNVCPRRIDFLYLRMDFSNGCNVGYAFVNFITVQDLLLFAREKLGEKWNMFSSEKVLQMSYANYQGKEALVEKFKNSCIMDEQEAWRPKIFYSEPGPEQGLPEPFPAPTHLRRKERSSFNRGALYVPGVSKQHGRIATSTLYHGGGGRHGQGSREGRGDRHERFGGRRGKSGGDGGRDFDDPEALGSKHGRGKGRM